MRGPIRRLMMFIACISLIAGCRSQAARDYAHELNGVQAPEKFIQWVDEILCANSGFGPAKLRTLGSDRVAVLCGDQQTLDFVRNLALNWCRVSRVEPRITFLKLPGNALSADLNRRFPHIRFIVDSRTDRVILVGGSLCDVETVRAQLAHPS